MTTDDTIYVVLCSSSYDMSYPYVCEAHTDSLSARQSQMRLRKQNGDRYFSVEKTKLVPSFDRKPLV